MGISLGGFVNTIFPGAGSVIGSVLGGPNSPNSNDPAQAEEARKAALRAKINLLYGIGPSGDRPAPLKSLPTPRNSLAGLPDEILDVDANQAFSADAQAAKEARDELNAENTNLAKATRSYYTDDLSRDYAKAERQQRFALARQGLLGGSADVDAGTELRTDRNLGATRVDEAVRRALAGLTSQRENERMGAINLVNAGAGDDAVISAQRGLKDAFDTASSQQKVNLFGDLFSSAADATTASNQASQNAMLAARYQNQLATFFPTRGSSSGRITAGGG